MLVGVTDTWIASVPVPLRLITAVLPVEESLMMVNCAAAFPVTIGLNSTSRVSAWPGFKVAGNVTADREKLIPDSTVESMVTGAVPVDVKVTD